MIIFFVHFSLFFLLCRMKEKETFFILLFFYIVIEACRLHPPLHSSSNFISSLPEPNKSNPTHISKASFSLPVSKNFCIFPDAFTIATHFPWSSCKGVTYTCHLFECYEENNTFMFHFFSYE